MKRLFRLFFVMLFFAPWAWSTAVAAKDCQKLYRPPCKDPKPNYNYLTGECEVAVDPAFVSYDAIRSTMKTVIASTTQGEDLSGSSGAVKDLMQALGNVRTVDQARVVAFEAWKLKVPVELQRHALALAKSMGKSPAETETANFMLSALEDPAAELVHCREWSRGTALEKKKAADHLALLLQNPNLAGQLK